jgi:hypothetical protein
VVELARRVELEVGFEVEEVELEDGSLVLVLGKHIADNDTEDSTVRDNAEPLHETRNEFKAPIII